MTVTIIIIITDIFLVIECTFNPYLSSFIFRTTQQEVSQKYILVPENT